MDKEMSRQKENDVYDLIIRSSFLLENKIIGTPRVLQVKSDYLYTFKQEKYAKAGVNGLVSTAEQRMPQFVVSRPYVSCLQSPPDLTGI